MDGRSAFIRFLMGMLIGGICGRDVSATDGQPDWWKARRDATAALLAPGADIGDLAAGAARLTPASAQNALYKFGVLMQAGMDSEAVGALRELKSLCPRIDGMTLSAIHSAAGEDYKAPDVAQMILELFADDTAGCEWLVDELLSHFLESGWTVEQVDAWLAQRPSDSSNLWAKERLRFNVKHGRGEAFLKELSDSVLAGPGDYHHVMRYLNVLDESRRYLPGRKYDLTWLIGVIKPERATQAANLASQVAMLGDGSTGLRFYRYAIEIPLTTGEAERVVWSAAAVRPRSTEEAKPIFEVRVREGMACCLLVLGRNEEAQQWVEVAARIRAEHTLGRGALLAGVAQAASGHRTIENQIRRDEQTSQNSATYWLERASYYHGRKEPSLEEEAYQKGLLIATSVDDRPESIGVPDLRRLLLTSYVQFLQDRERREDVIALLRKEVEEVPPNWVSSRIAVFHLTRHAGTKIDATDVLLWKWLAHRPQWRCDERDLLGRMLRNAPPADLDQHLRDAEQLAQGNDPTRCLALGLVLYDMHFPERAIPLLEEAAERGVNERLWYETPFRLSDAYAATGDWERAEATVPLSTDNQSAESFAGRYARMAVLAAQTGVVAEALRLWKRAANLNPSQGDGLDDLLQAGLREELVVFYRQMQAKIPTSKHPRRILKLLGAK